MDIFFLIKGVIVGISVSIPLGPIGVLIIQRTMNKGWMSGLTSGMGAAFADTLYAAVAAFGVTIISDFLVAQQFALRILGSLFLLFLGLRIFFTHPMQQFRMRHQRKQNVAGDMISVFFLTLSNPLTILALGAVFAGFGLVGEDMSMQSTWFLVIGILLGAFLWWFTLATLVNLSRKKIRLRHLFWINKITGALIILLGVIAGISIFFL